MAMSPERWKEITPSRFPWEREALEYIRKSLPDHDPYRAWTNFEFIAHDGSINEVDLLIVTPAGFFLVEIKSRPGHLTGDAGTWVWKDESGKLITDDNPILLANRKAKKLVGMIKGHKAMSKVRCPFLEPLVFCSAPDLTWNFKGNGGFHVCFREKDGPPSPSFPGVIGALKNRKLPGMKPHVSVLNRPISMAVGRALDAVGIRPSQKLRRIGDYVLGKLLFHCPKDTYQDFEATHVTVKNVRKRVRIYNVSVNESIETQKMIQKAAEREFKLHNALSHDGILKAESLTPHDIGPALIYPFEADGMRLDHYLHQYRETIGIDIRLSLIRQIAEAVKYAHGKGVIHRALSPYCIMVFNGKSARPGIKILNWQAGHRTTDLTTTENSTGSVTIHPDRLIEDTSLLYMAPEAMRSPDVIEPYVDVFSLGAIAYHIFSGNSPASSIIDLSDKLTQYKGLDISTTLDGVGPELRDLIRYSTNPDVLNRWDSVADFLEQLQAVEEEFTAPDEDTVENPLDANTGDILEGGFEVLERLGKGGSATVFLVRYKGRQVVLKLANQPDINERLQAEFETLKKIRHSLVVGVYEQVRICGLYGFTMQRAGDKTLAQRLREEGPFQLEFLKRFGADLLAITEHLEDLGIYHRDFKPENIGIGSVGKKGKLRLFLFDFSLSASSLDNIQVGTVKYHDPFIATRKPVRWDVYAERFCVAMTLYKMATGVLPVWGDGRSAPEMLTCEATLACESFDANIRKPMTDFFQKAFQRDYKKRFDNAEEMRTAWNQIFFEIEMPKTPSVHPDEPFDRENAIQSAKPDTQLLSLGMSPQALSALERMNVFTVRDLLQVPFNEFRRMKGVGISSRNEIVALTHDLHRANPDVDLEKPDWVDPEKIPGPKYASVDALLQDIDSAGKPDVKPVIKAFLGRGKQDALPFWPGRRDVATLFDLKDEQVTRIIDSARSTWRRLPAVSRLREDIDAVLAGHGGMISVPDLATAVLTSRGATLEEPERTQSAVAVCRAAIEAEQGNQQRRFFTHRCKNGILVINHSGLAAYAEKTGQIADKLASDPSLASPIRVIEKLRSVEPPNGLPPVPRDNDLLKIAVYTSSTAALSTRLEIYPRNMPALRMLRLSQGSLAGVRELTVKEIHDRVHGRYPEGERLPDRPDLDGLLIQAGLDMVWRPSAAQGKGAYCYRYTGFTIDTTGSTDSGSSDHPSESPGIALVTPEQADARMFDRKLKTAINEGAFLVLTVSGRHMEKAKTQLLKRFDLSWIDFDELFIPVLKQTAEKNQVNWDVVLNADAAPKDSRDWQNLNILVSMCMPELEKTLSGSEKTLLLTGIGLLARYDQLKLLEHLRDQAGAAGSRLDGLWILIPADKTSGRPTVDGKAVPLLGSGQYAGVPREWLGG